MPELPEVQTVVTTLRPRLLGAAILSVSILRPDIITPINTDLPALLTARRIADITRRGKRIIIHLDDANRFFIHLGMTGRLTLQPASTPRIPHTHAIFHTAEIDLRFTDPRRFGGIFWLGQSRDDEADLGPEPLDIRPDQLARLLSATTRPIKNALLDQTLLAGLGNIYADESLFAAAIHPLTRSDRLTRAQVGRLTRSIKQVLRRAINHRGSTLRDYHDADGNAGEFQKLHRVYARAGQPCLTCGTPIKRIVISGRSAHFCPKCQAK